MRGRDGAHVQHGYEVSGQCASSATVRHKVARRIRDSTDEQCIDTTRELESCGGCIDGYMLYNGTVIPDYDGVK